METDLCCLASRIFGKEGILASMLDLTFLSYSFRRLSLRDIVALKLKEEVGIRFFSLLESRSEILSLDLEVLVSSDFEPRSEVRSVDLESLVSSDFERLF